ncbi:hypothetical protein L1887_21344 [Cichorium endivia]|nr:hypothetical protein L1887_21344 [Cichorium endivia]
METLLIFAQHQDQYHSISYGSNNGSFGSSSRDFREINCRTFQSGAGILPTPIDQARSSPSNEQISLKSPTTPSAKSNLIHKLIPFEENPKQPKKTTKSSPVTIPISIKQADCSVKQNIGGFMNEFFYSELWAGPAYSNSPPPSSLPIPNFSVKPKRTVSLDLPSVSASGVDLLTLISKSAPTSPTSERHMEFFSSRNDSATKNLRRILNLDMIETD